ncbi:MAG: sigma-54 dependent transcriptional regulator [Acidobacteriota bacterium]
MALDTVLAKSVLLTSPDGNWRRRMRESLTGMRWQVREAEGGADAMAQMEQLRPEVLLIDHWLPDLEVGAFVRVLAAEYPGVDFLRADGEAVEGSVRSPRRHELLHALREAVEISGGVSGGATLPNDTAAWAAAPVAPPARGARLAGRGVEVVEEKPEWLLDDVSVLDEPWAVQREGLKGELQGYGDPIDPVRVAVRANEPPIAGLVGDSAPMQELRRLIRLVAKRSATVLILGETGSGKEVVAKAIHKLSTRANKPMVVLNCAAIPEALLEAELFGHTRGAFTGAVQSRMGRIEAANGGTLFLDEIGEMPLALQAKMLRFLDSGELQKVGDNDVVHVDVRVVAATHQHLEKKATEGTFRLDLYHRLAVFPLSVPPLRERKDDVADLAEFFLAEMGKESPRKRLSAGAMRKLGESNWPGNVRELAHVLERATILADESPEIAVEHVMLGVRR